MRFIVRVCPVTFFMVDATGLNQVLSKCLWDFRIKGTTLNILASHSPAIKFLLLHSLYCNINTICRRAGVSLRAARQAKLKTKMQTPFNSISKGSQGFGWTDPLIYLQLHVVCDHVTRH